MRILVLNGSPKGKDSITLQTVEYLRVLFSQHSYEILHVGRRIRSFEKDFSAAKDALEAADLIVFCYPVYTFLVPAQLHRFIELIEENDVRIAGTYATQMSTSKHFYDTTAHRFIADRCADLGLRYIRGFSADMDDILNEQGQREAEAFFRFVLWNTEHGFFEKPLIGERSRVFVPVIASDVWKAEGRDACSSFAENRDSCISQRSAKPAEDAVSHTSGATDDDLQPFGGAIEKTALSGGFRVALVTDFDPEDPQPALVAMIRRFQSRIESVGTCELVNLHEFPFAGGCLGCFNCASDGTCMYKDGFDAFLRQHINSADAVVYAYTIRDHSMGYRFKLYDDRQFCNGHRTVTMGKPVAYLVDGDLSTEENLRTLMEARAQVGGNYLEGVATDAADPDCEVDQLVETLAYVMVNGYTQPKNFYGVGGLKIFRDLIYQMQGLMKEDHRFYKEHGFYDFPQKKKGTIAGMYLVSAMMRSKTLKKKSKFSMTDGMMMSYHKVIEKAKAKRGN